MLNFVQNWRNFIWSCLFLVSAAYGSTYIVDRNHASASDSNTGTLSLPWLTIQHAADTMAPGDTVFIRTGTYFESVSTIRSGNSSEGSIVFAAWPGEIPVIDGTGVTSSSTGFRLTHGYITLSGIEIRNWDTGIWMTGAGHTLLEDCEVHEVSFGIGAADGAHDFILNRVEIHHFDLYGFDASPSGGADCYNGTFNDCVSHTGRDPQQNVDGFALGHGTQHDFVFNRCETYQVYDGFDISSRNTTLNRCLAKNCWSGGFKIWQDQVKLVNCIAYGSDISNIELDWDGQSGTVTLVNCTIFNAAVYNIWKENPSDILYMTNCILSGGDNIGLAFETMGVANYHGDYNVFHNDNAGRGIAVGYTDEFSLSQIAAGDWTAYSGQDAHSLVACSDTDLFLNPSGNNLQLFEISLAVNAGTSSGAPAVDYAGQSRPSGNGFDIGAYEYQFSTHAENPFYSTGNPDDFVLAPNYPNPFNGETIIRFYCPQKTVVDVSIYNLCGQRIHRIISEQVDSGWQATKWNGKDETGISVASGVYYLKLEAEDVVLSRLILMIK